MKNEKICEDRDPTEQELYVSPKLPRWVNPSKMIFLPYLQIYNLNRTQTQNYLHA